jgi:hypothetical protein
MPGSSVNLDAADAALNLTPQERDLYSRHLMNLYGPGGVNNPDGTRSSLMQSTIEHGGRIYNVPSVWNGSIAPETNEGTNFIRKKVGEAGWNKFPSYDTREEAQARYDKMHDYMDRDTAAYQTAGQFDYLNPASQSAIGLNNLVQPAQQQIAEMLGYRPTPEQQQMMYDVPVTTK